MRNPASLLTREGVLVTPHGVAVQRSAPAPVLPGGGAGEPGDPGVGDPGPSDPSPSDPGAGAGEAVRGITLVAPGDEVVRHDRGSTADKPATMEPAEETVEDKLARVDALLARDAVGPAIKVLEEACDLDPRWSADWRLVPGGSQWGQRPLRTRCSPGRSAPYELCVSRRRR